MQELYHSTKLSFNKIQRKVEGITNRMMSKRLQFLELHGLLQREIVNRDPLRVMYSITEKGRELMDLFDSFKAWGVKHELVAPSCVKINCNSCSKK